MQKPTIEQDIKKLKQDIKDIQQVVLKTLKREDKIFRQMQKSIDKLGNEIKKIRENKKNAK